MKYSNKRPMVYEIIDFEICMGKLLEVAVDSLKIQAVKVQISSWNFGEHLLEGSIFNYWDPGNEYIKNFAISIYYTILQSVRKINWKWEST